MITFLASPKPFKGFAKEIQYRAVRSWLAAGDDVEVILYGDSAGSDEAGSDLGVQVVKQIACAPSGIPYFGSIVAHAAEHGKHDLQVYINCDILLDGIVSALLGTSFPCFLLIGERIDLAEGVVLDMTRADWRNRLKELIHAGQATLHGPTGIDYFVFRRGFWAGLPPIIIGRGCYDNALLAHCFRERVPIIDATPRVLALHQYHDYKHVQGGLDTVFYGNESEQNAKAAGGRRSATMISDATYVLRPSGLEHQPCRGDRLRWLELKMRYEVDWPTTAMALRLFWRGLYAVGITRVPQLSLAEVMDDLETALCCNIDRR